MEKQQRSKLQTATQDARKLLEEEFRNQLLQTYDIDVEKVRWAEEPGAHLQAEQRLIREKLVAWIEHKEAQINDRKEALLLALREMAFTALNRFVALKLMEARDLVRPCVSGGLESAGFLEFTAVAQGLLADQESSYRLYLETIFEDVSRELRALFDPRDPASLLWPKRAGLLELIDILNRAELAELWIEDETLGWTYQYFNGADAKEMRDSVKGGAPRNSRELAVRNQFFTPRYVVKFLTENTLGRVWYEMLQGRTIIKERCQYLVRKPHEIWLKPGERPKENTGTDLATEELPSDIDYIQYRALKDPRKIRILDPACGSMHFGLYAFELYLEIYKEAWEIAKKTDDQDNSIQEFRPFVEYAKSFLSEDLFLQEVPRLILHHNLHGIDIDQRATQIARLTLWLRAQRAWQELDLDVKLRPAISRSNVVCAEQMPGEHDLLTDFVDQQIPEEERGLIQELLEIIISKMRLAGEAGSLLRMEEDIRETIIHARTEWEKLAVYQKDLFSDPEMASLEQARTSIKADVENLTKDLWVDIEQRLYEALRTFSEQMETGDKFSRKLFADDAANGFAYIEILQNSYDAVVMNPPFGTGTTQASEYIERAYSLAKNNLSVCFVDRGLNLLAPKGRLGALTTRTIFFNSRFAPWRSESLSKNTFVALCDLGLGVLDAMVETAMYVVENTRPPSSAQIAFGNLLGSKEKEGLLNDLVGESGNSLAVRPQDLFSRIPNCQLAYWLTPSLLNYFSRHKTFLDLGGVVARGIQTGDNNRFLRLRWEIPLPLHCKSWTENPWIPIAKGGEYSPWWDDIHLTANWANNGAEITSHTSSTISNTKYFFASGGTYPYRTTSAFTLRCFPAECLFSDGGWGVFPPEAISREDAVAVFNSRIARYFIEVFLGQGDASEAVGAARNHTNEAVGSIPWIEKSLPKEARDLVTYLARILISSGSRDETNCYFLSPFLNGCLASSVKEHSAILWSSDCDRLTSIGCYTHELEQAIFEAYAVSDEDKCAIAEEEGRHPFDYPSNNLSADEIRELYLLDSTDLASKIQSDKGSKRFIVKKSYSIDRKVDLIAHLLATNARGIIDALRGLPIEQADILTEESAKIISYAVGVLFGRWNIRLAVHGGMALDIDDPFQSLPLLPPGMLQRGAEEYFDKELSDKYPVSIATSGILVEEKGFDDDIVELVNALLRYLWKDAAPGVYWELCASLGVAHLRDYFARPGNFFADHLKRYSKSRRQAPIYWQISVGHSSISFWLYYHRLTDDTLYSLLNNFIVPRTHRVERELFDIESHGVASGAEANRLQEIRLLLSDLRILKSEISLLAPIWRPNLNDGVVVNHSILWRITPYGPWQKVCRECWCKLIEGDYDWAYLAFHLWPERVIPKCTTDRSLAIAHGLEERLWQETNNGNWLPRQLSEADLQALIAEHSNPAVKSALERFLAAPPPVAPTRTRASRSTRASGSSTPRRARGSAAVVDAEATRQVLLALTAAPSDGLAKAAIADLIGVEANALTAVIKQLKESGQIDQLGERRGARYLLSEQGRAAVDADADGEA